MYKTVSVSLGFASIIAMYLVTQSLAFGDGLFICKNGTLAPGDALTEKLKACNEPDLYKDKDPRCIAVCTTEAIGGMKDGIPDMELFETLVKTEFPQDEQANALERVAKCFQDRTFDKDDETCASVADFSVCGTKLVVETKC